MTRKDYVLIAAALKEAREEFLSHLAGFDRAAWKLSQALARDNPQFDRERFLKAAGMQS